MELKYKLYDSDIELSANLLKYILIRNDSMITAILTNNSLIRKFIFIYCII